MANINVEVMRERRSFEAGYRPGMAGSRPLFEGEPFVNFADRVRLLGIGDGSYIETALLPAGAAEVAQLTSSVTALRSRFGLNIPGVSWEQFQTRLLITKDVQPGENQPVIDIQVNTREGLTEDVGAIGSGVSFVSRILPGTKYGHFNAVCLTENYSVLLDGERDIGVVSLAPYMNQYSVNSSPAWAIAAELREKHLQPNPKHGSLCCEFTVVGNGSDDFNKRCMVFLPTNKATAGGPLAEFAQGIYWKTGSGTKYKDAMLYEGTYNQIMNARDIDAFSLIVATGRFSQPVIDFHSIEAATSSGAVFAINPLHNIQWRTASNDFVLGLGVDYSVPNGNALALSGAKKRGSSGAADGFLEITINGARKCIPVFNLA